MKIALIGYGKMGKEIEKVALSRGHEIVSTERRYGDHYHDRIGSYRADDLPYQLWSTNFRHVAP